MRDELCRATWKYIRLLHQLVGASMNQKKRHGSYGQLSTWSSMISVVDKDAVLWSRPDHLPARADQCSVILRTAAPMLEGVNFTSLSNLKLTGAI